MFSEEDLIKAASDGFFEELSKHAAEMGVEVDREWVENFLKEAGLGSFLQQGAGALKAFGQKAVGAVQAGAQKAIGVAKNEFGHLQTAIGNRMASPSPNTSFSKFLPGDVAQTARSGVGGVVDYAKGAVQRNAPLAYGAAQGALQKFQGSVAPIKATSKATGLAGQVAGNATSGIGHAAQDYMQTNHPVASSVLGGIVSSATQGAANLGGTVINAANRFLGRGSPIQKAAMYDVFFEITKAAAVSDEEAVKALDKYESLEKSKPTVGQVARYGALGAVAAPTVGALGDVIAGKSQGGLSGGLRNAAGRAVSGALMSGAVPLVRAHLDRRAEMGTLKRYIGEQGVQSPTLRQGKLSEPFEPVEKAAAGASTRGGFLMSSELPAYKAPQLQSTVQQSPQQIATKLGAFAGGTTPGRAFAASRNVGAPRASAPKGPAIADTVPTFGSRAPGANKTTIGKRTYSNPLEY